MSDDQQSVLLAAAREVDVAAIEKELTQLWKQAGESQTAGDAPVVRACTLNLLIVTDGEDRSFGLDDVVNRVSIDHPGRMFLITMDEREPSGLEAWVSARCSLPVPGEKQVCCEEIHLVAHRSGHENVPGVVTSLLVPDIPTVLIWKAGPDSHYPIFQPLVRLADRVLIDSSDDKDAVGALRRWGSFIAESSGQTAFGDLGWAHLAPWRTLLAQTFQPPALRPRLQSIASVLIDYSVSNDPHHSGYSQALLATGWLAHALAWELLPYQQEMGDEVSAFRFRKKEQEIEVRIVHAGEAKQRPGGIEAVTLRTVSSGGIEFRMLNGAGCCRVTSSLDSGHGEERIHSLRLRTEAELVSEELEILSNDPAFDSAMTVIMALLPDHT
jgi:glucose-6-phosphate dehydrogenase assembly protein OpcA